ncbi:MAG: efflux RND transporter permease subunit, partial [Chitinophagaceae bacterium]
MWKSLGESVLRYRFVLLALLLGATVFMGWHASQVKLSYDSSKAIPTDNPRYKEYLAFKQKFGEDGNLLVIGVQTEKLFAAPVFNDYAALHRQLKAIDGVVDVLSVPAAINLQKNWETQKLQAVPIFGNGALTQPQLDSSKAVFYNLPFYRGLLYNAESNAFLMGVRINPGVLASKERTRVVEAIAAKAEAFGQKHGIELHLSGLPLIRTMVATRLEREMKWFTIASVLLSALILWLFFRSISATLLSLAVVLIGVIWSFGTMHLFGYDITLLTALIPPLIVVIGIPNCIYFLNKYHTAFNYTRSRETAIMQMIEKMGIVTLFCNIAAAIGFAVFALTKSAILQEFGVVAGINIMLLFFISLVAIPAVLSFLGAPKERHTRYLYNKRLQTWLDRLELWAINHRKTIYAVTAVVLVLSLAGLWQLKSEAFIVDDLPKKDKIYTDLKFFETHFEGVMPLEVLVDTRRPNGLRGARALPVFNAMNSLGQYMEASPQLARPLSLVEGLKFAKQAFFEGDSSNYTMPSAYDLPGLQSYLSMRGGGEQGANAFGRIVATFMDSTQQYARMSVNMKDVGSYRLPQVLDSVQQRANALFDTSKYTVQLTGTSVTFLEGSRYIINGLKESVFWAFLLIALCMLYLFRSGRILLCSLIPNVIPLVITAGVMGWVGVPLKPSTV